MQGGNQRRPFHNIGFVGTRFSGTDGVSLEADKWVVVIERLGYECFYFAGECDKPAERSFVIPEADFKHPAIDDISQVAFGRRNRPPSVSQRIQQLKDHLKKQLYVFVKQFEIDALVVENALAIPMNLPLGIALCEFIAETGLRTIAHHHDFFWERSRFLFNCVWDYLNMAFPPHLPFIRHVVINSSAANQLSLRTGISSMLIPNVMDFDNPPPSPDEYTRHLLQDLDIRPGELLFLQPTRVVQRKGIEHAIELLRWLGRKSRLVISHASGDEGHGYEKRVRRFADLLGVQVNFVSDIIGGHRGQMDDGRKIYALADVYPFADLVTYPSTFEGFGNAFLEAVYFRRPILVNNYSIFSYDIKPKGFSVIDFDGFISDATIRQVETVLDDPDLERAMTEHNYRLACSHYSYAMLERRLQTIFMDWLGEST